MKQKVFFAVFAFALIFGFGSVRQAMGCSCIKISSCTAFYKADLVFIGETVGEKKQKVKVQVDEHRELEFEVSDFEFEVLEVFGKDKKPSKITIKGDPTNCSVPFDLGEKYLVFAYKDDKEQYTTTICDHTNALSEAKEDLRFLREILPNPEVDICSQNEAIPQKNFHSRLIEDFLTF